jgi:prephenate dehydratase
MTEEHKTVAFLGPFASYTHQVSCPLKYRILCSSYNIQATTTVFSPESGKYDLVPQTTIRDVFTAVQSGAASYGVVPFENSTNGSVVFTLDLLADFDHRHPDILVCGEIYLPVHHCLVGYPPPDQQQLPSKPDFASRALQTEGSGNITPTQAAPQPKKPRVEPIYDLKHVNSLYSHPQAWGQCDLFLSTYLKATEKHDASSTSRAAQLVAQHGHDCAAISSKIAAEVNGLTILAESIEDVEGNSTRFFILRRGYDQRSFFGEQGTTPEDIDEETEMREYKSLISFAVDHEEPGALADSLAVFKKFKLNLTSINSRPSGDNPWHYIFFVEILGRKGQDGKGGAVNDALAELAQVARSWRWLGSWKIASKQ